MKLIVYSHPGSFEMEEYYINKLFHLGMQSFHLRKPHWSKDDLSFFLTHLDPAFHENIVVHDHYDLLDEFDLSGIHLTRAAFKNGLVENALEKIEMDKIVSRSIHDLKDLEDECNSCFNRFMISPVFKPLSKNEKIELWKIDDLKAISSINLDRGERIALGGINPDTMLQLPIDVFDGVACLGYVWNNIEKAAERFGQMNEAVKKIEMC